MARTRKYYLKNNMPGSRKRQHRATGNKDIITNYAGIGFKKQLAEESRYCTFVVNKHFLITCYVCLLFCSCGHVTELTLVYIYC
jgi:hypothetical protein